MACSATELIASWPCAECLSEGEASQARLALLVRILLAVNASGIVTPSGLMTLAAQNRFSRLSKVQIQIAKLQLLCQIAEALA